MCYVHVAKLARINAVPELASFFVTLMRLQSSEGCYISIVDAKQGVLVVTWAYSPAHMHEVEWLEEPDRIPSLLPALRHMSDVIFLQYKAQCAAAHVAMGGLKHVFVPEVHQGTQITESIVVEIWKRTGERADMPPWRKLPDWRGRKTFTLKDEEGLALLASPSLQGIAFMLLQHRAALGRLTIKQIAFFGDDSRKLLEKDRTIATSGPSFYIELERLPISAGQPE